MDEDLINGNILDTTPSQSLRKPIPWWRASLLGAFVSCIFMLLQYTLNFVSIPNAFIYEHYNTIIILLYSAAPIVALIRLALWGSHTSHLQKMMLSAILMVTVFIVVTVLFGAYVYKVPTFHISTRDLFNAFLLYGSSVLAATIIWLLFGNWEKFRNQVEP